MAQGTDNYILVVVGMTVWIQELLKDYISQHL